MRQPLGSHWRLVEEYTMDINSAMPAILVSKVQREIAQGLFGLNWRALSFHAGIFSSSVFMSPEILAVNDVESLPLAPSRPWDCCQFNWLFEMRFRVVDGGGLGS